MTLRGTTLGIILLTLVVLPGAAEVLESAVHWVAEGHTAHAAPDGDEHRPADPEHGCSSTVHTCGCHASLVIVAAPRPPRLTLEASRLDRLVEAEAPPMGFWPAIDRPPRA